ncbi:MAG: hypothetical protein LGR52_07550 [Candidatus Thiosymbion ectosymbiont of Robbea hypermnestra]|nr:hypothetical protein [Candidatus Thiosymbion ectosymbiont of Robbea hypermnestra]
MFKHTRNALIAILCGVLMCLYPVTYVTSSGSGGNGYIPSDTPLFPHLRKHVLDTPVQVTHSLSDLADYLRKPAKNQTELAYSIFYWLSQNIAYDTKGLFSGEFGDLTPEGVLRRRSAVCSGYSRLFHSLAEAVGLEVREVIGKSKGYGYAQTGRLGDHAWNAVKIDGRWHLLDATWGAGYVSDSGQFVRRLQNFYFMTPPEQFIYGHLPDEASWQLLSPPVSSTEFKAMLDVEPEFFRYGLQPDSHQRRIISTQNPVEQISILSPDNVVMTADLYQQPGKIELPDMHTFLQRQGDRYVVWAAFPRQGEYLLRLYAKPRHTEGSYDSVMAYTIRARQGKANNLFPKTYASFTNSNAYLNAPLDYYLQKGKRHHFSIKIPSALKVVVIDGEMWHHLENNGQLFTGTVSAVTDKIGIYAKLIRDGTQFTAFVEYQGKD